MHRHMKSKEAWFVSVVLVCSINSIFTANAQESAMPPRSRNAVRVQGVRVARADAGPVLASQESNSEFATVSPAQEAPAVVDSRKLYLVIGQTKTVRIPEPVKRVQYDQKDLIEAKHNDRDLKEVFVTATALKPGVARLMLTDIKNGAHRIDVYITLDAGPLQGAIEDMFPNTNVRAVPAGEGGVAIVGFVDNAQEISDILDLAEKFYPGGVTNGLKAVGPQQVQLKVMIAEVNRTKLRALGFNFLSARTTTGGRTGYIDSLVGGLLTGTADSTSGTGLGFDFNDQSNILFGKLGTRHEFRGFMRALKEEGLAKIIAEPTLVTFSGRAASMIVGGEFPIVVPGQQGTFTVEFREYGNRLDFVPVVLGSGRIRLEVRPELSQLDYANGVSFNGFEIPGIIQRRIDTSVELNTGETFVAGGLIRTSVSGTTNKIPFLGDLAIIGTAFRTVEYEEQETELIIMVTPELVEPLRPNQRPCAFPSSESTHPSNGELFLKGNIEVPPCTPCETSRRAALGLDLGHVPGQKPTADRTIDRTKETVDEPPAKRAVIQAGATMVPQRKDLPPQAQRPGSMPGLIGRLGYDAGR